tara:strand:+ start:1511 stop:2098 length:588 start_codon:yes stop_codon:yes gene_type:complete
MPTLDDITTLQTNAGVAPNDAFAVVDRSSSGSSRVEQVPAALLTQGYSHAWVVNYDSPTLTGAGASATTAFFNLKDFTTTDHIRKVKVIVTEAFTGSGATFTQLEIDVGESGDSGKDNYVTNAAGKSLYTIAENTGGTLAAPPNAVYVETDDGGSLHLTLTATGGHKIDVLAAGQVVVLADIFDPADFKNIVPAS